MYVVLVYLAFVAGGAGIALTFFKTFDAAICLILIAIMFLEFAKAFKKEDE